MKAELLNELEKHVVFDRKIVAGIVKNQFYAGVLIHRQKKTGQITELERDKYTVQKDPFLVASRVTWPSYISMWSALRYHNLTEQLPQTIWVVTTKKRRNARIEFAGTAISFVIVSPKYFFGYDKVDFEGFDIFVADPEKSIVDSMLFRKVSVSEISEILSRNLESLRPARLIDYAIRTGNKALIKRIGFMLERFGVPSFNKLGKFIYRASTPLDYSLPAEGDLDDKWHILENVKL